MDSGFFDKIRNVLSNERLVSYGAQDADEITILARYLMNTALCEALYLPIQMAEIVLRNIIYAVLTRRFDSEHWYDKAPLVPWAIKQVVAAKDNLQKKQKPLTSGRIVAELHFGFWTAFFNKSYAQTGLGACLLKQGFSGCPKIYKNLHSQDMRWDKIRILRNRIFHHERIVHWNDLSSQYKDLVETIGWISAEIREIVLRSDRFTEIHSAGIEPWKDKIRSHWPRRELSS